MVRPVLISLIIAEVFSPNDLISKCLVEDNFAHPARNMKVLREITINKYFTCEIMP